MHATSRLSVRRITRDVACCTALAVGALASLTAALVPTTVEAAWPDKPIKIVVPFAAGGPADQVARLVAAALGERLAANVFIENKGGAGGNIGIGSVAKADADGSTFLLTSGAFTLNPALYEKVPYDAIADFAPVCEVATSPIVIVAVPGLGVKSIAELVALAKAEPDKLNYASPGAGTQGHLAGEMFKKRSGAAMVHVNHPGAGPAMLSLLAGTVQVGATALAPTHPHIKAGKLVGLAVTGESRWHDLPDVPTLVELGYKDIVVEVNFMIYAPAKTPADVVARVSKECVAISRSPAVADKLKAAGFAVTALDAAGLATKTARELAFWRKVVADTGIKPR